MQLRLLRAKLHRAAVTESRLDYHGSITIDEDLMDAVGIFEFEAVTVANLSTGGRAETYVIPGRRGDGQIEMNGAMARLATPGDRLIILSFAFLEANEVATHRPKVVVLDRDNQIIEKLAV